jgi:hypothetical protein
LAVGVSAGASPSGAGGTAGAPLSGAVGAGTLFGIVCLMIKNKATRIIIIRITTAAGFCFFSAIFSHLLSSNLTKTFLPLFSFILIFLSYYYTFFFKSVKSKFIIMQNIF